MLLCGKGMGNAMAMQWRTAGPQTGCPVSHQLTTGAQKNEGNMGKWEEFRKIGDNVEKKGEMLDENMKNG